MVWYAWKLWRFAWGLNSGDTITDGQGRWVGIGYLYILVERASYALAQHTLYEQVYYRMLEQKHSHNEAVDMAVSAVECFSDERTMTLSQLDNFINYIEFHKERDLQEALYESAKNQTPRS
jgi:hypothetical protein